MDSEIEKIIEQRTIIEQKLDDLKKRWPAHSVKPQMILELEQLEDELDFLREKQRTYSEINKERD